MSYFEASIITIFGVILPTGDVGSDYWVAGALFLKDYSSSYRKWRLQRWLDKRYLYGGITLAFPTLAFVFTTIHWWQMENPMKEGGSGRLKTLPLLLCQLCPQYRMIRILHLGLVKKDPQWRCEQKIMLENVSAVEPFLESVPQCFWIVSLGNLTRRCVGWSLDARWFGESIVNECAFFTSVLSASYGLTNFLRVGPLKVIPNQPASGFGHPCFLLVFFSVLSSIVAKGLVLGVLADMLTFSEVQYLSVVLFVPNILFSLTSLLVTLGFKDSICLAIRHPAIVMMPVFTSFTFGPEKSNCKRQIGSKLRLHYGLTIFNLIITFAGILGLAGICKSVYGKWAVSMVVFDILKRGLPPLVVSALLTTVFILCDMRSSCSSCAKPVRIVREIKGLLGDSQSLDDVGGEITDHQQPSILQQPLVDMEMKTFDSEPNRPGR